MQRTIMAVLLTALLVGCGGDDKPPQKTVFDPQLDALKKARAVEQKVLDAGQKQRDNIEKQEN